MPPGTLPSICTPKGPNSDRANRMVKPPAAPPPILNPPCMPTKKILSLTGVSAGAIAEIIWLSLPILIMPPINAPFISPPKAFARMLTPMEAISIMGNSPLKSFPRSIFTPSMVPENSAPAMPSMELTLAESVRIKSRGSSLISRHSIPISLILMGSQLGHPTLPPVADSTPKYTPNPCLALKLPSPRKAKLRPSPLSLRDPTFSSAPRERKLTTSSLSPAPVSILISTPLMARKEPSSTRNVSASNLKESTFPSVKLSVARNASVLLGSSPVSRSVILALTGISLKKAAPPEAMNISPSKSMASPKITSKLETPNLISSNSRILPSLMAGSFVVPWLTPG